MQLLNILFKSKNTITFKKLCLLFFIFSCVFYVQSLNAQSFFKSNNLSQINVETLTDADILNIQHELDKSNTTIEQAEVIALSKGMNANQFVKLKMRIQNSSVTTKPVVVNTENGDRTQNNIDNSVVTQTHLGDFIFGSELFDNPSLSFEPDLKIATPMNYILGPGDELQISIYGVQEFNTNVAVTVEGKIALQNIGQLNVGGITFEAAVESIKKSMGKAYATLISGQSKISISLSKISTIKVTIIGSKKPGNYSVSSFSTVFNALYLAGGPSENGSYRTIELIRNNKLEREIDIYRFLMSGDQSDNIALKNNDVIRIPTYTNRVKIEGQVKRPGIFELLPGETFNKLLMYASGFTDNAYSSSVNLVQKTEKELKVKDILQVDFDTYQPKVGDMFTVYKILDRYENRVTINGAVFRPGVYEKGPNLTVSGLILKAEGLKEDVYKNSARLVRLKDDLTPEIINIDLAKALSGDTEYDLKLMREDQLIVYSIFDFKDQYNVSIQGEIRTPGKYNYIENLSLNDLIIQAGGTTDASSKRIEIARMVKSDSLNHSDNSKIELINIETSMDNKDNLKKIFLQPFDVISVRKMPTYYIPEMISISGEVIFPGKYAMSNKKERVINLINRAGGLTPEADIYGIKIKRTIIVNKEIEDISSENKHLITIPLKFNRLAKNENSKRNMILLPGDQLIVSKIDKTVKVAGAVLLVSQIPYKARGIRYYLKSVGGTDSKACKRKIYIVYPNGMGATTRVFLGFKNYPKVRAGSEIVVPIKPERKKVSVGEIVSITSILTSMTSIIYLLLK